MCSASDIAHERVLARLRSLGVSQQGAYRTGVVADVTGYSRERIRQRCMLRKEHPAKIAFSREHTCAHRMIPHEEVVRLVRLMMALPETA